MGAVLSNWPIGRLSSSRTALGQILCEACTRPEERMDENACMVCVVWKGSVGSVVSAPEAARGRRAGCGWIKVAADFPPVELD